MTLTKPLRSLLLAALATGLAAPIAGAFGIGLQPTTVEMEVEPGDRKRQVINLANVHTEKTISLTLGLADWSLDEAGQIQLTAPGETDDSAADWVRFSPAFVILKPGEAQQIVVDMATPSRLDRAGDFRFALLASTVLPEERGGQSGVWKKYQIASLFYLTAGDAESLPAIIDSGITVTPEGTQSIELRFENTGNAHARLEGVVDIRTAGGETTSLPIANLVVLNGAARTHTLPLDTALPADASIEVRLDNIFAPQVKGASEKLPTHTVKAERQRADIVPPGKGIE